MQEFDFLKEFGKNLDREQAYEPGEQSWDRVASALDLGASDKRRKNRFFTWFFPMLAAGMLLFMGGWIWYLQGQTRSMHTEIERMRAQFVAQKSDVSSDKRVESISVVRYDTIYRTVFVRVPIAQNVENEPAAHFKQWIAQAPIGKWSLNTGPNQKLSTHDASATFLFSPNSPGLSALTAADNQGTTTQPIIPENGQGIALGTDTLQTSSKPQSSAPFVLNPLPLSTLLPLNAHRVLHIPNSFDLEKIQAAKPARNAFYNWLIYHHAVGGVTTGLLFPNPKNAKASVCGNLGLFAQFALNNHFRVQIGAAYGWTNFDVKGVELDQAAIPVLTPPTPNDVLDHVLVNQPILDCTLGLQYVLFPMQRFHPYLGASWVVEQSAEQQLKYLFTNSLSKDETTISLPRNNSTFNFEGVQLGLGAEWQLRPSLTVHLEGNYQRQYHTSVPFLFERWGLKTGLAYHF
jgi:hypothetical protein